MSKLYVLEAIENYAEHGKTNFVFSLFFVVIVFRKILDSILLLSSRMHLVQWLLFLSLFWLFFFFLKEDRSKKNNVDFIEKVYCRSRNGKWLFRDCYS